MKKNLIIAMAVLLAGTGCKKYLNVNVNPNTPTQTNSKYVLTNALNRSAAAIAGGAHITSGTWTGYYAHSTSFTGGGQEKTYVFTNNDFNFFDGLFDNLADYQYVIDNAGKDGVPHLVGPSKIMQVLIYQRLVDLYGNVPYTEALKGASLPTPKYDDAKTIYESLLVKLTEAISDINAATWPVSEAADIFFKGDKTQWKRMANTLRLRLAIRMSNVPGFSPAATITAITTEGSGFITSPVLCQPGFVKSSGKLNPYYQNFGFNETDAPTGDFRKMNKVMVDWLVNSGDFFRLGRMCSKIANPENDQAISTNPADFKGVPLGGDGSAYLSSNVSSMGREQIIKGQATLPTIVMTDAEAKFLQAEAIERGWMTGSAQTMYESGVTAAFRLAAAIQFSTASATTGASDAAAATYYGQTAAVNGVYRNYPSAPTQADRLKAIWVQKWVALCNIDGQEAWSEYRRTNSPTNPNGNCPVTPHSIVVANGPNTEPVRLFYPLREESVNVGNVPQNINVFTSRIFWDIN
jgi:hypothetical protein